MNKLMKSLKGIVFMIVLVMVVFGTVNVYADTNKQYVYDNAGIFSESEIDELTEQCEETSEELEIDIVILTADNTHGKSSMVYSDDFMDENGLGYEDDGRWDKSCVLLFLDFDNQEVYINTTGLGILCVEDDDIEDILDDVFEYIPQKDYRNASVSFISSTRDVVQRNKAEYANEYMDDWENFNGTYEEFYDTYVDQSHNTLYMFRNPLVSFFSAAIVAAVVVAIMASQSKSRMTVDQYTYMDRRNLKVHVATDRYTNTTTKRYKASSSSSGGGGGHGGSFHSSGGGHSHGGGGRHM